MARPGGLHTPLSVMAPVEAPARCPRLGRRPRMLTTYAAPTPEQAYGDGPYSGAYPPGTQVVYAANGQAYAVPYQYPYAGLYGQQPANQVIIREQYRDNDSDLALGVLAGAPTGMALGSLFWVF
ncbi:pleckstrin homology domain-containing family B member 2-like [Hippopotamus amphibius kiboko]|uniref:pleckstrin homology domain-containing family B member 2-like n=1 Tax=Hippopotamus amphibius kiboko TaxID=575201 RepID=UPI0025912F06|nr:pleckstrin homology domain-containing family B member 2-like [Hippopotamus amphibius kiboko]